MAEAQVQRAGWRASATDPWIVAGTVISIGAAVVAAVVGSKYDVSIVVALVGIAVTLQVDAIGRLEAQGARRSAADRLYTQVHTLDEPARTDLLALVDGIELARQQSSATSILAPVISDHVNARLGDLAADAQRLSQGVLQLEAGNTDVMVRLVDAAKHEVRAVAPLDVRLDWWESTAGTHFLEANARAVRRGVQVTRIAITDGVDQRVARHLADHVDAGVQIHRVDRSAVPFDVRHSFFIVDDEVTHWIVGTSGYDVDSFSARRADVQRYRRSFERLQALSVPFAP